jgi:cytochrome P450
MSHGPQIDTQPEPRAAAGCPVPHSPAGRRKSLPVAEPAGPPIGRDERGVWHVRGHAEARAVLRAGATRQAGFRAELIELAAARIRPPILYQEGDEHRRQRAQTARFFTPRTTEASYRGLMQELSDRMVAELLRDGRADLSRLSMALAVGVAARVIGLTNSLAPGMDRRIDAFFDEDLAPRGGRAARVAHQIRSQRRLLAFYLADVRPAIQARRRQPAEDLISHLVAQGYADADILTECITFAAAGMATTREFISAAAWHMLEQPALRARYLVAGDAERHAMLEEILRVEPVVGHIFRRASEPLRIESGGVPLIIPPGALIDIHVYAVNDDPAVAGPEADLICPGRVIGAERVGSPVMSFGDGRHSCPGQHIAIQESDIFLRRLLALEGLRIERAPDLEWKPITAGYEIRRLVVAVR